MIKVIIAGFKGRAGSAAVKMVQEDESSELVALVDPKTSETAVDGIPVFNDKLSLVGFDADVWVGFYDSSCGV